MARSSIPGPEAVCGQPGDVGRSGPSRRPRRGDEVDTSSGVKALTPNATLDTMEIRDIYL